MTVPAYATDSQFREFVKDTSNLDTDTVAHVLLTASRGVERICGRHFYQTTETQYFSPPINNPWVLDLGDMELATVSGLAVAVQWSNSGNYNETRTITTDFVPEPRNQSVNGIDGWPYTSLRSLAKLWPPRYADFYLDTVRVTGTFGWPAIPDPVIHATLIGAARVYKTGEAPFDVAGFGDFGVVRVRGESQTALALLQPYKKQTTLLMA